MVKSVVTHETESVASFAALRPEDQEALARIFPWLGDLSAEKKEKFMKTMNTSAQWEITTLSKSDEKFAENVLDKALKDAKHEEEMKTARAEDKTEKDKKIEELYAQLWLKNKELSQTKRQLTQANKDVDAATQIEFWPVTIAKLALLKRQQKKLDYFMKKDPEAGMRYVYYNGMFGIRHIKRALNKKWWIKENPEKVHKKYADYIKTLKSKADTPKKQAIVRRLEEYAKTANDKYVDIYNKRTWPKKFSPSV